MLETQETSVEAQPQDAVEPIEIRRITKAELSNNYEFIQRSILTGMGGAIFDAAIANRMMEAVESERLECWVLHIPGDELGIVGTITFFIATDPLIGERYLWIYSLHCSLQIALEQWRVPFNALFAYAREKGCSKVSAKTQISHVIEIAKDNGCAVGAYLERGV